MHIPELKHATKVISRTLTKNSPSILTGLGVAGVFATAVMAVKATPKALILLDEEKYNREKEYDTLGESEPISAKDAIALTWKCYLPATIMGAVTIACIIGANKINLRRNAVLASLYSLSESALKEYQAKVVETIGKNKERKIKDDMAHDKILNNPANDREIIITGNGDTLCYDAMSGRYFKSDIEEIRRALNKLSRDMMTEMNITLNEVYNELGLKSTKLGEMVGWNIDDGLIDPEFSSQLTENGVPCLVLDFSESPRYFYQD